MKHRAISVFGLAIGLVSAGLVLEARSSPYGAPGAGAVKAVEGLGRIETVCECGFGEKPFSRTLHTLAMEGTGERFELRGLKEDFPVRSGARLRIPPTQAQGGGSGRCRCDSRPQETGPYPLGKRSRSKPTHTLVELWAWKEPKSVLVNRSDSPWDRADRRPSHADRRKAIAKAVHARAISCHFRPRTADRGNSLWLGRLISKLAS